MKKNNVVRMDQQYPPNNQPNSENHLMMNHFAYPLSLISHHLSIFHHNNNPRHYCKQNQIGDYLHV